MLTSADNSRLAYRFIWMSLVFVYSVQITIRIKIIPNKNNKNVFGIK